MLPAICAGVGDRLFRLRRASDAGPAVITFRISDGLGNQLFQYAAAMALTRRLGVEIRFSLDYF